MVYAQGRTVQAVLKPDGTFILNIKEKAVGGERHTYVIQLILEMRKQGWLWTEEFIWHKKNCYPGKWPNRFRDAWERCIQFNRKKKFRMFQEEVMVPVGDRARTRLRRLSETDRRRDESRVKSGFGKNISNWLGRKKAYPTNVLHMATECSNRGHSAAFPLSLPEWFIRLFTKEGDIVLDPFVGSGTTAVAARKLNRRYIGIDINEDYCRMAEKKISEQFPPGNAPMNSIDLRDVSRYVNENIDRFHENKLKALEGLNLKAILKKKNPYLFRAKNITVAADLIKDILDAFLYASEEKLFGDFLEDLAIFIAEKTSGGKNRRLPVKTSSSGGIPFIILCR